jgi:superoxide dismutase, Cu-Zn family
MSLHGFHIHEVGKCEGPDFKSAGGHFNPSGKEHGKKNPKGHHAGDMENVSADPSGNAKGTFKLKGIALEGKAEDSLFRANGTSIVIHASADDHKSNPAGNSGDRIACGVIEP